MFVKMNFIQNTSQRLKSRKLIGRLYTEGTSVKTFPLRMVLLKVPSNFSKFKTLVGVSVPKRNFKRAVDRNRIKRLLRESFRNERSNLENQLSGSYIFMISYLAKDEWTYEDIHLKMKKLLQKFIEEIQHEEN